MEELLQTYKALSEEMRLRIVMLLTHGELCVCDVMEILGEAQPKVSRHLAYLKHSGLVKCKRVGTWMHYSLKDQLDDIMAAHIRFLTDQVSQLLPFQADIKRMEEVKRDKLCEDEFATGKRPRNGCLSADGDMGTQYMNGTRRSLNGRRTR